MAFKRSDLAIINRSFWPVYPVIGEALLRFAEKQSSQLDVCVIMQDHADIRSHLQKEARGQGVGFFPCKAWSCSGSGIARRVFDAVFFMFWVFAILIWTRPSKVYVSTDPPVLVPFIVYVYSKLSGAKYIYHLQDIHPEATNVVIPVNKYIYRVLQWLDSVVMRHAHQLITITDEMAQTIRSRSHTTSPIAILSNPAVSFDDVQMPASKKAGFTFCGNAGRLQRIPLLIDAIEAYLLKGGTLPFTFAGGGIYSEALRELSEKHSNVTFLGLVSASEAAQLNADFEWALLPIEDEVTHYAFPSKSSSYVFSGAYVAAICSNHTSVASWVSNNHLGVVIYPDIERLCSFFQQVEKNSFDNAHIDNDRSLLKKQLEFGVFIDRLQVLVVSED